MNIAICDDDASELSRLHEMIDRWAEHSGIIARVREFSDGEILCNSLLDNRKYDVFILDVIMPKMDGISLARKLRSLEYVSEGTPIIFLTSAKEFAVESYEVRAFHYLLKPVSREKLDEVLGLAYDGIQKETDDAFIVRTADGEYCLKRSKICRVVFQNRMIDYVCEEKTIRSLTAQESFKNATAAFDKDSRFFRCGASLIVNLSLIRSVDKNIVTFADNKGYPVPRASAKELYKAWIDYWLEGEDA